jgi:hypothetical protein
MINEKAIWFVNKDGTKRYVLQHDTTISTGLNNIISANKNDPSLFIVKIEIVKGNKTTYL